MRVNSINPRTFNYSYQKNNFKNNFEYTRPDLNLAKVPAIYAVSFLGGKSLNLSQTYSQIKEFGSFPADIEEKISEELKISNPQNKKLIDIHREKYDILNQMDSLEEAKLFFPEFENVISDSEITYNKNSFIDDVKEGKIEYFDPDKDLALQLLQMYWGDGFSLNDLRNEFALKDINYVFNKLNIPKVDKTYGHYLKFSDEKYNERFTLAMSERAKNIKRASNRKGIKKAPLSLEHKKKISQSLIEYYKNHPKEASSLDEETLKKFSKTPQEREIFSQVMLRAWSYQECRSVRKAMSKFLSKNIEDIKIDEVLDEKSKIRVNLKDFFQKYPWAKQQLSKAMIKSWERQRYLNDMGLIYEPVAKVSVLSPKLAYEIEKITAVKDINQKLCYYIADKRDSQTPNIQKVADSEISKASFMMSAAMRNNINGISTKYANYQITCLVLLSLIYAQKAVNNPNDYVSRKICDLTDKKLINELVNSNTNFTSNELFALEEEIMNIAYKNDALSDFLKTRTECFETLDKIKSEDMPASLGEYMYNILHLRRKLFSK